MPDVQPLLSICIPTFNRSRFLAELLASLHSCSSPGALGTAAELIVSDNHSIDDTAEIVRGFQHRGLAVRYVRNETNLGADANFLRCLSLATGRYLWVLGDDDLVMPGAIAALISLLEQGEASGGFDLAYLSSFGFTDTPQQRPTAAVLQDRFGRFAEIVTDGAYLLEKVNALIGLISVVIINRDRLLRVPHPALAMLTGTNLMQTGWIFPLLHRRCRVLFVWQRLLGYRHFNSGGWGICEVFGVRLDRIAAQYFAAEPALARALMNGVLRYWLPDSIMLARAGREGAMHVEDTIGMLRPRFGRNWRFWLFVYPVATLPLPLARSLHRALRVLNRATRIAQAAWRHLFVRGTLLRPIPPVSAAHRPSVIASSATTMP